MHEKNIKKIVIDQLKKKFPNWRLLNKKEKRSIAKKVLAEEKKNYDFNLNVDTPIHELLGIPHLKNTNFMNLEQMKEFVEEHNRRILELPTFRNKYINDAELRKINDLLDDSIVNKLLAPIGFTPAKRKIFPSPHENLRFQLPSPRNLHRADAPRAARFFSFADTQSSNGGVRTQDFQPNR